MIDLDAWLDSINPIEGAKWTPQRANDLVDNGDGTVTLADLDVWRSNFGNNYATGSGAVAVESVVPEPVSIMLVLWPVA
jgi:hypothetical protein